MVYLVNPISYARVVTRKDCNLNDNNPNLIFILPEASTFMMNEDNWKIFNDHLFLYK